MATAGALTLVVGLAAIQALPHGGEDPHPPLRSFDSSPPTSSTTARSEALLHRAGCSSTGLDGVTPRSAIVRDTDGSLRLVDYRRGWAGRTDEARGDLVAVCRSAAR